MTIETEVDPRMVQRLLEEGAQPVTRLTALIPPSRGKARSPTTLTKWILLGKHGVLLEGFVGPDKAWWSSAGALARFFARLTEERRATEGTPPLGRPAQEREQRDREERS
ncbi:MAG TPA: hypothetical protein VMS17_31585, partial [Gemmataceae bacterium]|nr:hypothetical protein [Gemmataceae bacterium]